MDNNISKIGASANFFVQNKAVKKMKKTQKQNKRAPNKQVANRNKKALTLFLTQ